MAGKPDMSLLQQRFNRLVVVAYAGSGKWDCACDCGGNKAVTTRDLKAGFVKSCGCLQRENGKRAAKSRVKHGMAGTPTYESWKAMRNRCSNPKNDSYPWYGGRGIRVCERWQSFDAFFADMGERPDGQTIDRIDPDGDYTPTNCRWATLGEQYASRRNHNQYTKETVI